MCDIRVRFAPSPTGYLHVGGLRTALYNFLFAKHNRGKFILRIEDTDRTRFVEGAVENLVQSLKQMGIDYDEGPDKDGKFGPYIQSERTDIYRKYSDILVKAGHAYPCFCTKERLDKMRLEQKLAGKPTKYDKHCLNLPPEVVEEKLKNNEPHVIRLNIPDKGELIFEDEIRGKVKFEYKQLDDQILLKSDGYPTYHLANVVDDHLMKISHVIRGEEWLPSTPKHILLYKAFEWDTPKFAHLPLLLNQDRSKLSKRQGDVAVEDYLRKEYIEEALLNFVALLGWHTSDNQEIFSKEELVENFTLDRVNKAGAVFDLDKLKWMNSQYLHEMSAEEILQRGKDFIDMNNKWLKSDKNTDIVNTLKTGMNFYSDLNEALKVFDKPDYNKMDSEINEIFIKEENIDLFKAFMNNLNDFDINNDQDLKKIFKNSSKEAKVKGKMLYMPIRIALTGAMHGPEIPNIIRTLGNNELISRFTDSVKFIEGKLN